MNFWAKWKMCFHWVATFGFDGADVRKENLLKKKKRMTLMTLGRGLKPI